MYTEIVVLGVKYGISLIRSRPLLNGHYSIKPSTREMAIFIEHRASDSSYRE